MLNAEQYNWPLLFMIAGGTAALVAFICGGITLWVYARFRGTQTP